MTQALLYFPDYRSANPYQTLLYQHAGRDLYPRPGTIAEAVALHRQQGGGGRVIFHLHWEDAIYRQEASEELAWQAAQAFVTTLETFLDTGGALVWTLHNEAPHDGRYPDVHQELAAKLAGLADVIHVHSLAALAFARRRLGADAAKLALVHHGNYVAQYPRLGFPVTASRAALGLPAEARVLLLFGRLGAYKGGPELLEAFASLDDPGLWLVIAGKQVDPLTVALGELPDSVRGRIVVEDRFISPEQVPRLFHAADLAVLPYRASLTSGTALLALSQARPVLAPAFAPLAELLADGHDGLLYAPEARDGLRAALQRLQAIDDAGLAAMQVAARAKAEMFDWRQSGLLLNGIFARLLAALRPQRSLAAKLEGPAKEPAVGASVQAIRAAADAA
jgi:glycosyltransferase involved in cell wall biosynthesis